MALRDQPYLPLYVRDYLTDEKLNECSAATQGVYIKLMCLMHKSEEYGTILLEQKYKQTDNQIKNFASKLGRHLLFTETEIYDALSELIANKVITLDDDKLLQKRMIKDNQLSLIRSKVGEKGGKKTQFAKAKLKANTENENENENEFVFKEEGGMGGDEPGEPEPAITPDIDEQVTELWQLRGGKPSTYEMDLTQSLIKRYDFQKLKKAFSQGKYIKNFKSFVDKLDQGNFRPDIHAHFEESEGILKEFNEAFLESRGMELIIPDIDKELNAIDKLVQEYKNKNPGNEAMVKTDVLAFMNASLTITEEENQFIFSGISPVFIANQANQIRARLKSKNERISKIRQTITADEYDKF